MNNNSELMKRRETTVPRGNAHPMPPADTDNGNSSISFYVDITDTRNGDEQLSRFAYYGLHLWPKRQTLAPIDGPAKTIFLKFD